MMMSLDRSELHFASLFLGTRQVKWTIIYITLLKIIYVYSNDLLTIYVSYIAFHSTQTGNVQGKKASLQNTEQLQSYWSKSYRLDRIVEHNLYMNLLENIFCK